MGLSPRTALLAGEPHTAPMELFPRRRVPVATTASIADYWSTIFPRSVNDAPLQAAYPLREGVSQMRRLASEGSQVLAALSQADLALLAPHLQKVSLE